MRLPVTALRALPGDVGPEPFEGDLDGEGSGFQGRVSTGGREFKFVGEDFLTRAGAKIVDRSRRCGPYPIDLIIEDHCGARFVVLAHGTLDNGSHAGLRRVDRSAEQP